MGLFEMRRHLANYFKGIPDFKPYRLRLVTENDPALVLATLDEIGARFGDQSPEASSIYDA